jgi:lysophospholipase L1-like esterase
VIVTIPLLAGLLLLGPAPTGATTDRLPEDGSRVLFIGDSITQAGQYVLYVEAYLLTRFPDRSITVINHGLSSETAAGTSEPDHPFPRPCIHDRFARDVTDWRPDHVVACYGMNDGIYHPFDPELFARYQDGISRLIDRARNEAEARIDLMTPPPFDPYRRQVGDPDARHFGYRYPAVDYDDVLDRFGEWVVSRRADDLLVADVHDAVDAHLDHLRADRASASLAPDGVHPDATGHWLIAQTLLLAWGAPAEVAEVHIDATEPRARSGEIRDLSKADGALSFAWTSPLPLPIDPRWDPESLRIERISDRLNRYRLQVDGLDAPRYRLVASFDGADPAPVGEFSGDQLARGIDLNTLPDFPTVAAAREMLQQLAALRDAQGRAFRAAMKGASTDDAPPPPGEDQEEMATIRDRCQPRELRIRIEPVADRSS